MRNNEIPMTAKFVAGCSVWFMVYLVGAILNETPSLKWIVDEVVAAARFLPGIVVLICAILVIFNPRPR